MTYHQSSSKLKSALLSSRTVVAAIISKELQTRFGGSYLSYVVAIGWPLMHGVGLMSAYVLMNRIAPVGESPMVFALTGVFPYILCLYPGRVIPVMFLQNKVLLLLPIVRPIHIIVSALIIEILTGSIVIIILVVVLSLTGIDIFPLDYTVALEAILATLYFGIGLGVLNITGVALIGSSYIIIYIVTMIIFYVTSFVFVPISMIPGSTQGYLIYNPLFDLVQWTRSSYYSAYSIDIDSKTFVIGVATACLFLGLAGERFLRSRIQAP